MTSYLTSNYTNFLSLTIFEKMLDKIWRSHKMVEFRPVAGQGSGGPDTPEILKVTFLISVNSGTFCVGVGVRIRRG